MLIPVFLKVSPQIKEDGALPNLLYKTTVNLVPKPDKDTTKKEGSERGRRGEREGRKEGREEGRKGKRRKEGRKEGNYRPIFLMNIDAEFLNKV